MASRTNTPRADADETPSTGAAAPDTQGEAPKKARGNPMLGRGHHIDADGVLAFGADVRTLVEEVEARLDAEVVRPLSDMEASVCDPQSPPLVESSRQMRGHVDGVLKALRVLSAAAGKLGQNPTA